MFVVINRNFKLDEIIGISLFALSLIFLLVMLILGLNQAIWNDEIFSLSLIYLPLKDMLIATAADVHPPLYYLILMSVFKLFNLNPVSDVVFAKLVSTVPLVLLICFSYISLRKEFGSLAGGIFSFCVVAMPKMMLYGVEVRMYSWAMLFLTLSLYYVYLIAKKPSNNRNWSIFTLFSLMGAFTHYYAIISIATIYISVIHAC